MSNLLAVGFERIHLDLYWDVGRRTWSFCPVSLPSAEEVARSETIAIPLNAFSTTTIMPSSASSPPLTAATTSALASGDLAVGNQRRQFNPFDPDISSPPDFTSPASSITKATLTINLATSGNEAFAALPTTMPKDAQEVLYSVGDFTCSGTSAIDILTTLLPSFLTATDDTLHGAMQYVIFNIHVSASIAAPDAPAARPAQADLPSYEELIGQYFLANASTFLYTPTLLRKERANLTDTWFDRDYNTTAPLETYFENTGTNAEGKLTTTDGWPSSSFTLFRRQNHYRLVFGFGNVDPQMEGYNFTGDGQIVFSPGYINDMHDKSQTSGGSISQGCIYDPTNTSLSAANNSWAMGTVSSTAIISEQAQIAAADYNQTIPSISNLTNCGFLPLLNTTLGDASADVNFEPYRAVAFSATWSWAWGEPRTADRALSLEDGGLNPATHQRCAVLDPAIPGGRWRVTHCEYSYYAACRVGNAPLEWTISSSSANYSMVEQACPSNSSFAVPRTAVENRYLLGAYQRSFSSGSTAADMAPLFINFNSLNVPSCWVIGVDSTCPYDLSTGDAANIYIPTVAGVVILVLTVLLIVIKCGANRAHSRRRRKRGADGWDYEGVPS